MNITSPFKEDFAGLVREKSDGAQKLGAVNTVVFRDGEPYGCNTDPDGVFGALGASGIGISGKKAVVLGAGGAAKAAVYALQAKNAGVTVANRTEAKARAIADAFACETCPMEEAGEAIGKADILVSALSAGARAVEPGWLKKGLVVLDANYSAETALARDAKLAGCRLIDGREWLVHQGAEAFMIFTGKEAPLETMRRAAYSGPGAEKRGIALIGMMGAGKDSVSKALAAKNGMRIMGTDAEVERVAGMKIRDIFASEGEGGFRKRERGAIESLGGRVPAVINCGGGAVIDAENRKALRRIATVVWLWAGIGTILRRVPKDGSRPLLNGADAGVRLKEILAQRKGAYCEASDLVVPTDGKKPEEVAERILYEIH
jgi:shikimate dehydrogenase